MSDNRQFHDLRVPATLGWVAGGSMLAALSVLCCFADPLTFFVFHSFLRFAAPIVLALACSCSAVAVFSLAKHFHWLGAILLTLTACFQGILIWVAIRYGSELFSG